MSDFLERKRSAFSVDEMIKAIALYDDIRNKTIDEKLQMIKDKPKSFLTVIIFDRLLNGSELNKEQFKALLNLAENRVLCLARAMINQLEGKLKVDLEGIASRDEILAARMLASRISPNFFELEACRVFPLPIVKNIQISDNHKLCEEIDEGDYRVELITPQLGMEGIDIPIEEEYKMQEVD